jgi:hypothetical protein
MFQCKLLLMWQQAGLSLVCMQVIGAFLPTPCMQLPADLLGTAGIVTSAVLSQLYAVTRLFWVMVPGFCKGFQALFQACSCRDLCSKCNVHGAACLLPCCWTDANAQ